MLAWLMVTALASDPIVYIRQDQPLSVRRCRDVVGRPPRCVGRRGSVRAWVFPDGNVERYERGGVSPDELVRFDASHGPHLTVRYTGGQPVEVVVRAVPEVTVSVADWEEVTLGEASLRLRPGHQLDDGILRSVSPAGRLTATWTGDADPFDPTFPESVAEHAGARLIAAHTTWLQGRPAARITLSLPDPGNPRAAEVWAVRGTGGLLLVTWDAPAGTAPASLDTLAPGRAAAALLTWQDAP